MDFRLRFSCVDVTSDSIARLISCSVFNWYSRRSRINNNDFEQQLRHLHITAADSYYLMLNPEIKNTRKSAYEINPLFLNRWSPRSMTGEELNDDELMSLFETARWAPSSYNNQPWRFIYSKRNTEGWDKLFDLLVEGNKIWAKNSAALVVLISRRNFEFNEQPSITHQLDAGAAWENLALEASTRGIVTHGMQGFDYQRAKSELGIPETYDVMSMIAIGKMAPKESLPSNLQERESPSDRKPLTEIVMKGYYREGIKK
ncbi:MAG: nitroreductase family protein [Nitrososphaeraceae archaeon]